MSGIKQVIVIRKDLNMRKGKMVAQGAHASMACILNIMEERQVNYEELERNEDGLFLSFDHLCIRKWLTGNFAKICVSVDSEAELLQVYEQAKQAGIYCSLIKDAGLTEFKEPTFTAVGIGPFYSEEIDKITGGLKLL